MSKIMTEKNHNQPKSLAVHVRTTYGYLLAGHVRHMDV
jgi:hypothetical protein